MPQKLQHPPTPRIAQRRIHHPLPQPFIIAQRPLQHPVPTDGELRTTCRPDLTGHVVRLRERRFRCPLENIPPDVRRDVFVLAVRFLAAGVPVAAEVDVAVFLNVGDLEGAQGVDVVVEGSVGVPCVAEAAPVWMDEGEGDGEGGVVVYDVGEVGHGFVAFILWGCEGCVGCGGGGIDGENCVLPAVVGRFDQYTT